MKYVIDHDYHIHTYLSKCSGDPGQTNERLLAYAKENGLKHICVTNHFWDAPIPGAGKFHIGQDLPHIQQAKPLPVDPDVTFHFGCECEINKEGVFGVLPEHFDEFEFMALSVSHLHMKDFTIVLPEQDSTEARIELYKKRMEWALALDLPWHKVGLAHPTTALLTSADWQRHLDLLDGIDDETWASWFTRLEEKGAGIELNIEIFRFTEEELPRGLRPYQIAKKCGSHFYLGSDAHRLAQIEEGPKRFARIIELLELTEDDKWHLFD